MRGRDPSGSGSSPHPFRLSSPGSSSGSLRLKALSLWERRKVARRLGTSMPDLKSIIAKVAGSGRLTQEEARSAFDTLMSGAASPVQIGAFLTALRVRGETVD